MLTGGRWSARRKACPSATLSGSNPTRNGLESNFFTLRGRPVTAWDKAWLNWNCLRCEYRRVLGKQTHTSKQVKNKFKCYCNLLKNSVLLGTGYMFRLKIYYFTFSYMSLDVSGDSRFLYVHTRHTYTSNQVSPIPLSFFVFLKVLISYGLFCTLKYFHLKYFLPSSIPLNFAPFLVLGFPSCILIYIAARIAQSI